MALEYARNAAGIAGAAHAESEPDGETLVVGELRAASSAEERVVRPVAGTRLAAICGEAPCVGFPYCGYGMVPGMAERLGLVVGAHADDAGVPGVRVARSTRRRSRELVLHSRRSATCGLSAGCSTHLSVRCSRLPPSSGASYASAVMRRPLLLTMAVMLAGPGCRRLACARSAPARGPARLARRRRRRPADGGRVAPTASGTRCAASGAESVRLAVPLADDPAQAVARCRPTSRSPDARPSLAMSAARGSRLRAGGAGPPAPPDARLGGS